MLVSRPGAAYGGLHACPRSDAGRGNDTQGEIMNKILATGLLGLALVSAIPAVAADSKADKTWQEAWTAYNICLLYTSPSPRD